MYASYFGLKETPFNLTPDTKYFFLSRQHRDALNSLLYGIHERKGFIVLTGGIGTGKTTICRTLLAHLDQNVDTALIFNSFMSDLEILETVAREFKLSLNGQKESIKGYIDLLSEFLLANFAQGRISVLIIDEAQNLSPGALEQIRMISNLETEEEKLLQIILIGQPELGRLLEAPSLKQLNERITVRYDLMPLDSWDIGDYITHRVSVAGGDGILSFSQGALGKIYRYSKGIPRRVNAICDRAILIAYSVGKPRIKKETIRRAIRDIKGLEPRQGQPKFYIFAIFVILIMVVAFLAGIYYYAELTDWVRSYLTW